MGKVSFGAEEWQDHRHRRDHLTISSPPSIGLDVGATGGTNCILHNVSKFDTLAGIAIKYGVEVADIKRLNGLVTDLQMFALKTLQIPPGRHPPSPSLSNGHDHDTPQRPSSSLKAKITRRHSDLFDSFQSLKSSPEREISPAMTTLYECYNFRENPNPRLRPYRKSKSTSNCFVLDEDETNDFSNCTTPEKLLKEDNSCASPISAITGKGLALRPKPASRTVPGGIENNLADSSVRNGVNGVRKSMSTSCLQDSDNGVLSSIWSLKPDFQALTTAAITRPIFDGLPKPVNRRNKAALD